MRRARVLVCIAIAAGIFVACGSRSGLLEPRVDADAGVDASVDAGLDAPIDAPPDVVKDAPVDVVIDALPPCDPLALFVYLVTEQKELYRYDPSNGSVTLVGTLACPTQLGSNPFSMGVSRTGIAYVLYSQLGAPGVTPPGKLFAVSVEDAKCAATDFVPGQHGFNLFGMGFALDDDGAGETLYVADIKWTEPSFGLASIDLDTFELGPIGALAPPAPHGMELTSSDDGKLYAFIPGDTSGGDIVNIDKNTADILDATPIPVAGGSSALAFAYWGGDFYIFTAPSGGSTTITRYSPADKSVSVVGTLSRTVVGAGVTTCKAK